MRLMPHHYTHLANVLKAKVASGDGHLVISPICIAKVFRRCFESCSLGFSTFVSRSYIVISDIGHSKMHCPGPNAILSSKPYSLGASVHASAPMPSRATSNMRHSNLHRSIAIITPTFSGIAPSNQYHIDTKLNTLH